MDLSIISILPFSDYVLRRPGFSPPLTPCLRVEHDLDVAVKQLGILFSISTITPILRNDNLKRTNAYSLSEPIAMAAFEQVLPVNECYLVKCDKCDKTTWKVRVSFYLLFFYLPLSLYHSLAFLPHHPRLFSLMTSLYAVRICMATPAVALLPSFISFLHFNTPSLLLFSQISQLHILISPPPHHPTIPSFISLIPHHLSYLMFLLPPNLAPPISYLRISPHNFPTSFSSVSSIHPRSREPSHSQSRL